ncbi:hypothetical protein ACFFX0_05310 [Citricoccus parietis]|uniref:Uncharacterized protein n=1 Tax=Citricoccus parietis TaxID=592307 RepID=A0ABV5FVC3_9MICC
MVSSITGACTTAPKVAESSEDSPLKVSMNTSPNERVPNTETPAPHRKAKTSQPRGSGSHRSTHRRAATTIPRGTSASSPTTKSVSVPRTPTRNRTTRAPTAAAVTSRAMPQALERRLRRAIWCAGG